MTVPHVGRDMRRSMPRLIPSPADDFYTWTSCMVHLKGCLRELSVRAAVGCQKGSVRW